MAQLTVQINGTLLSNRRFVEMEDRHPQVLKRHFGYENFFHRTVAITSTPRFQKPYHEMMTSVLSEQ